MSTATANFNRPQVTSHEEEVVRYRFPSPCSIVGRIASGTTELPVKIPLGVILEHAYIAPMGLTAR